MSRCLECNDTGVIETGNNDLPCNCPAGDKARFNVAGCGNISGAELKNKWQLGPNTKVEEKTPAPLDIYWDRHGGLWVIRENKEDGTVLGGVADVDGLPGPFAFTQTKSEGPFKSNKAARAWVEDMIKKGKL